MEAAQTPPPPAAAAAAAGDAKRARRRSRYLSPPYTHTHDAAAAGAVAAAPEVAANEAAVHDVSAADALSALHAAALRRGQGQAFAPPLRFLALYRRTRRAATFFPIRGGGHHPHFPPGGGHHPDPYAAAAGDLNAGPAMPAMAGGSPALGPRKRNKKSVQGASPAAVAAATAAAAAAAVAAATATAAAFAVINKHQGVAMEMPSQSANAAAYSAVKAAAGGGANSAQPKKNKKRKRNIVQDQQHFSNPVALVLDFAEGTPLPSRDELLAAFRRFGSVIDSEAAVDEDRRNARVVFASRDEANVAYSFACTEALGAFGPPFATPRLQDLPPITRNAPPPLPKIALPDMRKNLEKMICSLTRCSPPIEAAAASTPREGRPATGNLLGEMQGLLAKVDKALQEKGASSDAHHH
ncbi:hypothetical protein ACP4OV_016330 [Aristida adscensionis]